MSSRKTTQSHSDSDQKNLQSKDISHKILNNKYTSLSEELHIATGSKTHRIWTRSVIIIAVAILVYFYSNKNSKETKFALVHENLNLRMQKFQCSDSYEVEIQSYPCLPKKCGRFVMDKIVEQEELEVLLDLARKLFSESGGSEGGASIFELHTGALSFHREKLHIHPKPIEHTGFINLFEVPELLAIIREEHFKVYNTVKDKIKQAIAEQFGIPSSSLYLTYPTFFSRLANATARILNDEYWHEHVDKDTYEFFHYTSLLYLNTYNKDFNGGRFIFVNRLNSDNGTKATVEPKRGRVVAFTSGKENVHYVEKVTDGERYAVTISFTCNEMKGISDPQINPK